MRAAYDGAAVALFLLVCAMGCAHRVDLYVAAEKGTVSLVGKSVMVLPPLSIGPGHGTAIIGSRVMDPIFSTQIAGVRFHSPKESVESPARFEALRTALLARLSGTLPVRIQSRRKLDWIFESRELPGTRLPRMVAISLSRTEEPSFDIAPRTVPREALVGITADYVLASVAFPAYEQVSQVTALLGILPFFWSQDLGALHPRCLFILYETKSGNRVWESVVAVEGRSSFHDPPFANQLIDSRAMPFVGLAYLLTGEIEGPLARTLRALDGF